MSFFELSDWEFVTSSGGTVTVGFVTGGLGMYQIKDNLTGDTFQVNYAVGGGGIGASVKGLPKLLGKLMERLTKITRSKSHGSSGSASWMPSAGLIFARSNAPSPLPLRTFTDGVFNIVNFEAVAGVGSSWSGLVWFKGGNPGLLTILAVGVFIGTEIGLPGLGVTASVGRVLSVDTL